MAGLLVKFPLHDLKNCVFPLQGIREFIQNYTGQKLPAMLPRPRIAAYGEVLLSQQGTLLSQLGNLVDGIGIYSETPKPMEEYGQWCVHLSSCRHLLVFASACMHAVHQDNNEYPEFWRP